MLSGLIFMATDAPAVLSSKKQRGRWNFNPLINYGARIEKLND
jgi:hypothetical protein